MDDTTNPYAPSTPEAPVVTAENAAEPTVDLGEEAEKLRRQGKNGANWFYWIAALSLVNSVIFLSGGEIFFVCGLAVTMIVDAIAGEVAKEVVEGAPIIRGVAFVISLGIASVVAGCGWISGRGNLIPFGIGIALYVLDALVFLLLGDMMSFGFHLFALWGMVNGLLAFRKYNAFQQAWQDEQLAISGAAV